MHESHSMNWIRSNPITVYYKKIHITDVNFDSERPPCIPITHVNRFVRIQGSLAFGRPLRRWCLRSPVSLEDQVTKKNYLPYKVRVVVKVVHLTAIWGFKWIFGILHIFVGLNTLKSTRTSVKVTVYICKYIYSGVITPLWFNDFHSYRKELSNLTSVVRFSIS